MSITLYEKQFPDGLTCTIRHDKYSPLYYAIIYHYGRTIYSNGFHALEGAKRALSRNIKKYL